MLWALCGAGVLAQTVTYYHNDLSGSPVMATDASGNVVWKENYLPYGDRLNEPAAACNNRLWFAGKPFDEASGLSYFGGRYYDPTLGRFMGVDPVQVNPEDIHSFNRYAYANNNPYKFVDPDGRSAVLAVTGMGLLVVGGAYYALAPPSKQQEMRESLGRLARAVGNALHSESANTPPTDQGGKTKGEKSDNKFPDRRLPRDEHGNPVGEPNAEGPHTQLGQKDGRNGKYDQAREFDANGKPVRDIDFTDHGRPGNHPNPHQHDYVPNSTGGTPQHGPAKPLSN